MILTKSGDILERIKLISLGIILIFLNCYLFYFVNATNTKEDYWSERAKFLLDEQSVEFGSDLKIRKIEKVVNQEIMKEKQREIDEGKYLFSILLQFLQNPFYNVIY